MGSRGDRLPPAGTGDDAALITPECPEWVVPDRTPTQEGVRVVGSAAALHEGRRRTTPNEEHLWHDVPPVSRGQHC